LQADQKESVFLRSKLQLQNFPKIWNQIFLFEDQTIKDVATKRKVNDKVLRVYWMELSTFVNSHDLTSIQTININLIGLTEITSFGIQYLARKLTDNWKTLQILNIDFRSCCNITDKAIEAFTVIISRKLTKLQSLGLFFIDCRKITDQSLKIVGKQIGNNLFHLQEFSVSITASRFISDQGIATFSYRICRPLNQSLQKLTLNFSNCWKISDDAVEILIKTVLKHLYKLQKLTLLFVQCEDLTESSLKTIETQFKNTKTNVQELILNFKWQKCFMKYFKK